MRHVIGWMALAALVASGCGGPGDASSDAAKAEALKVLDAVQAATGAVRQGDVTWYVPDNLYEYIDGDAGRFVDAGFVRLAHTEWQPAGAAGKPYVELDLYDLGTPLGALDILADSRTETTKYLAIAGEAHDGDELLELRVGRYYVRITPRHDLAAMKPLARAMAEAVAKAAPAGPTDDQLIAPLPPESLVPHTVAFASKAFLGRDFLNRVREATYEAGGKRVRLFLMETAGPDKAKSVFGDWKESVPPQTAAATNLPNLFTSTEVYIGSVTVTWKGRYFVGAIGDPAAARPLLAALVKKLE